MKPPRIERIEGVPVNGVEELEIYQAIRPFFAEPHEEGFAFSLADTNLVFFLHSQLQRPRRAAGPVDFEAL